MILVSYPPLHVSALQVTLLLQTRQWKMAGTRPWWHHSGCPQVWMLILHCAWVYTPGDHRAAAATPFQEPARASCCLTLLSLSRTVRSCSRSCLPAAGWDFGPGQSLFPPTHHQAPGAPGSSWVPISCWELYWCAGATSSVEDGSREPPPARRRLAGLTCAAF